MTVSVGGGTEPAWARNGELFYRNAAYEMMAAKVTTTPALRVAAPIKLFGGAQPAGGSPRARYAVTSDGQRFLMLERYAPASDKSSTTSLDVIRVVLNWTEELKRRLP